MITELRRPSARGHVCWSYDDPAVFDVRARDFLVEGLHAGERIWYVASGRPGGAR